MFILPQSTGIILRVVFIIIRMYHIQNTLRILPIRLHDFEGTKT